MKFKVVLFIFILLNAFNTLIAGPGDTTEVQVFTYGSSRDSVVVFPSDTNSYEKVLMYYTLKCDPSQNPACGEWDYLTYTNLYEYTGVLDSVMHMQPYYLFNGNNFTTIDAMTSAAYNYSWKFQYTNQSVMNDSANFISTSLKNVSQTAYRESFVLNTSDINFNSNLDTLTAIRIYLSDSLGTIKDLRIRIKHTQQDSINNIISDTGFTTVYDKNTELNSSGWHKINFAFPFVYNQNDNLLVDISYNEVKNHNPSAKLKQYNSYSKSTLYSAEEDYYLDFENKDYIELPTDNFANLDSAITIMFWQKGESANLPSNTFTITARDTNNKRVFNIHQPWGNGNIYWDAGNSGSGSYDRIYKPASLNEYTDIWVHWAFTKDVATGEMKIYRNGNLWHSGSGKNRRMYGVNEVYIGNSFAINHSLNSALDDIQIYNTALSQNEIGQKMHETYSANLPSNLLYYLNFNENGINTFGNPHITSKASTNYTSFNNIIPSGMPEGLSFKRDIKKSLVSDNKHIALILESGSYNTNNLDSVFTLDSNLLPQNQIIVFEDTTHPGVNIPTDTIYVYPTYERYLFNNAGQIYDTIQVAADTTFINSEHPYWDAPFEIVNTWELGRFITPYGYGVDLGQGHTWVYDVSDFVQLLHDSVHLKAGNWQELLDLKFLMIEGSPARDIIDIQEVYYGRFNYTSHDVENSLNERSFDLNPDADYLKLNIFSTGHGFGGNENCAEFCPRNNKIKINGSNAFNEYFWRDNCDKNPLYPQGGTWIYDRANWCPGDKVNPYTYNLTPWVNNDSISIDYDLETYTWNGQGSTPYYRIAAYLVSYDKANFQNNASIIDIKSPNKRKEFGRINPACTQSQIIIRNDGGDSLKSLEIEYGLVGGNSKTFNWTGSLAIEEQETVVLPAIDISQWTDANKFFAEIKNPNSQADEYIENNRLEVPIQKPEAWPNSFIIQLKTNSQPHQTAYTIKDKNGNIVHSKSNFTQANHIYRDTVSLGYSCFTFQITDSGENGLKFWANMPPYGNETAGSLFLRNATGQYFKSVETDFGGELSFDFTAGFEVSNKDIIKPKLIEVYPNPSEDIFNISISLERQQDLRMTITDISGRMIKDYSYNKVLTKDIQVDLSNYSNGVYFVNIQLENEHISRKIIKSGY